MSEPAAPQATAAGMYDYYLGGSAHSLVDRAAAEQVKQAVPEISDAAWANRGFLQRAVKRLAGESGIWQFIDIGAGLPTQRNTHDVVAEVTPRGRVVYVDIDPVAVARGGEILSGVDGATIIQGDIAQPEAILAHPEIRRLIDFTQPVALLMVAVLHFVPDDADPWALVDRYLDAVPSGSYLALSHASADRISEETADAGTRVYASSANPLTDRSKTEIERFFRGLEIMLPYAGGEPGVVQAGLWGADEPALADSEGSQLLYVAVARKP